MDERRFKDLSELTLMDDYMFGAVMQDPVIAKTVIEQILSKKLRRVAYVEPQRTMKERYAARAVRLDLYVEDEHGNIYNVEVQTTNKHNLPRRMRYYQSIIDLHILSPGADYLSLRPCYLIFICNYDPFGLGRCVYTFENRCLEVAELAFGDDTAKVVVNTKGTQPDISDELRDMLRYIDTGEVNDDGDSISALLDRAVSRVKNSEERRREYMVMLAWEMEKMAQGRQEEEERYSTLIKILHSMNRIDDVIRAAEDRDYRAKLYREFGLI